MTDELQDARARWQAIVDRVISNGNNPDTGLKPVTAVHQAMLRDAVPLGSMSGYILVTVGSNTAKRVIETDLSEPLDIAIKEVTGSPMHVVVAISDDDGGSADTVFEDASTPATVPRPAPRDDDRWDRRPTELDDAPDGYYDDPRQPRDAREPRGYRGDRRERPYADSDYGRDRRGYDEDYGRGYRRGPRDGDRQDSYRFQRRDPVAEDEDRRRFPTPGPNQQHAMNFDDDYGRYDRDRRRPTPARDERQPRPAPERQAYGRDYDGDFAEEIIRDEERSADRRPAPQQPDELPPAARTAPEEFHLNPKFTFDTFVQGQGNQLAFSAAIAVAERPGQTYNPLFIAGGSGLGKTHLLHAIGHLTSVMHPNRRVRYISCEEFVSDFINSVRESQMDNFRRRYRELDVLLIDDIQFLSEKESTQEEFFFTFNALHQVNKQIVLASDRPPSELRTLEERLRTRFESGLSADLQAPDLETRIAILSKKAEQEGADVPDDVLFLIAERARTSVRTLEGELITVLAQTQLLGQEMTLENVEKILGSPTDDVEVNTGHIKTATAEFYGLTIADLEGTVKRRPIANARMVAMYLCRSLTEMSLAATGEEFGGRDHTTVINAEKKITARRSTEKDLERDLEEITKLAKERAAGR